MVQQIIARRHLPKHVAHPRRSFAFAGGGLVRHVSLPPAMSIRDYRGSYEMKQLQDFNVAAWGRDVFFIGRPDLLKDQLETMDLVTGEHRVIAGRRGVFAMDSVGNRLAVSPVPERDP